jgi:hypothetical protein
MYGISLSVETIANNLALKDMSLVIDQLITKGG